MKVIVLIALLIAQLYSQDIYTISVKDIDGKTITLDKYKNKVMLIVNVASKCGFTKQYAGLQELHNTYASQGLSILGFPCNQFLSQEPGTEEEIKNFCMSNFGVSFDMFSKIDVNGENAHPLYRHLKENASGLLGSKMIKWNFTKFLVDRNGNVVGRYSPSTKPSEMEEDIKKLLIK